jgi:predicted nuclease with TOPRIM domain
VTLPVNLQPFEQPQQEFKGPLYHINTRGRTREEALDNLRVLIPEFAQAEQQVKRLRKQVRKLKKQVTELKDK